MKINPINSYDAINKVNKNSDKTQLARQDMHVSDEVSISDQAKSIDRYIQKAKNAEINRSDMVNNIKSKVKSGEYKVDSRQLAEKIVESITKK
ncbi:MAG: flagellar biosynthesis anti-sigma factor FlgM [Clostridia bacterium]|jgi:negative regulator of flagellin synthesis FlgM